MVPTKPVDFQEMEVRDRVKWRMGRAQQASHHYANHRRQAGTRNDAAEAVCLKLASVQNTQDTAHKRVSYVREVLKPREHVTSTQ